jgi:TonB family protein
MKNCVLLLCLFGATPLPADAEPLVIIGPFGVPIQVQDEAGKWSIPIKVYSDANVEIFVPDITSMGWKSWTAQQFRTQGTYQTRFTIFYKTDKTCLSDLPPSQRNRVDYRSVCRQMRYETEDLLVDTRKLLVETTMIIAAKEDAVIHPEYITTPRTISPISSFNQPTTMAISRVSSIVREEIESYSGLTAQEAELHNSEIVRKMIAAANTQPVPGSPDTTAHADRHTNETPTLPQESGINGPLKKIGGSVSAPVLIYSVEPEFSEEARKAKVGGNVLVNCWVDPNGLPSHVHVIRGVGHGLDEMAIRAVRQYRFKPAVENGKPVVVELNVEINFQISHKRAWPLFRR